MYIDKWFGFPNYDDFFGDFLDHVSNEILGRKLNIYVHCSSVPYAYAPRTGTIYRMKNHKIHIFLTHVTFHVFSSDLTRKILSHILDTYTCNQINKMYYSIMHKFHALNLNNP